MCRVLKLLEPRSMKPFVVRDCGDALSVETSGVVLVLNKKLEKIHLALRDLEVGLTLHVSSEAISQFEKLLEKKLTRCVLVVEEVDENGECLGSC